MAISVNGFGGAGGSDGQRGNYYMKILNASSAVLNGLTVTNNPTPAVGSMQKLLDIPGPGRLLLLAAYGHALNDNKKQHYASATTAERTNGYARVRVAADERIIYKACMMVPISIDDSRVTLLNGRPLPPLIVDPYFCYNTVNANSSGNPMSSMTFETVRGMHPSPDASGNRTVTVCGPGTKYTATEAFSNTIDPLYYLHTPEDDNQTGVLDYHCSVIPGGLYFDGNLTIHAAFGISPDASSPNGVFAIYELFEE